MAADPPTEKVVIPWAQFTEGLEYVAVADAKRRAGNRTGELLELRALARWVSHQRRMAER